MIPFQVQLIAIPRKIWEAWPEDRQLMHLANDALGIERRIQKGVDVVKERKRYKQLCDWIETKAIEAAHEHGAKSLQLGGPDAPAYAELIERLRENDRVRTTFAGKRGAGDAAARVSREALGKTIFPPGEAVSDQRQVFERLSSDLSGKDLPEVNAKQRTIWMALAAAKAKFYKHAESTGSAVIEVLSP